MNPLMYIDPCGFKPSCFTVIEGTSELVPETLFHLCAHAACKGQESILVDGANSANPYALSRAVKSMGSEPRMTLSHIHVARAFTEYQMDEILSSLHEAVVRWNPSLVAVLYLSNLFSTQDGKKLFDAILQSLKDITRSLCLVTVVASFGGMWWGDRMVAGNADRVIRIDETKTLIKIRDGNNLFEHVPIPPGQTRFIDFIGGEMHGQDCAELQGAA